MSPMAAARFCAQALCPNKATYRGRCQQHATQKEQTRYNAATRKWYSDPGYIVLKAIVLAQEPDCRECGSPFDLHVDHIVPHRGDYELFFRRENLQVLCSVCHGRKTKKGE
jgi:5-methylcytosine-specific restriction protein A